MGRLKLSALTILAPLLAVLAIPILLIFLARDWSKPRSRTRLLRQLRGIALLTACGLVVDAILISCILYAPYILIALAIFWAMALFNQGDL